MHCLNLLVIRGADAKAIISNYLTDRWLDFQKTKPSPVMNYVDTSAPIFRYGAAIIRYENGISSAFDELRESSIFKDRFLNYTNDEVYEYFNTNKRSRETGIKAFSNLARYGYYCKQSLRKDSWGTMYGCRSCYVTINTKTEVRIIFETIATRCVPIFQKLAELHPELKFDALYCNESDDFVKSSSFYNHKEEHFTYTGRKKKILHHILLKCSPEVHVKLTSHEQLFVR